MAPPLPAASLPSNTNSEPGAELARAHLAADVQTQLQPAAAAASARRSSYSLRSMRCVRSSESRRPIAAETTGPNRASANRRQRPRRQNTYSRHPASPLDVRIMSSRTGDELCSLTRLHLERSSDDDHASTPCVSARKTEHILPHARGRSPWGDRPL